MGTWRKIHFTIGKNMTSNNVEPVIEKLEDLPDELKKQLSRNFMKGNGSLDGFIEKLEPILKNGPRNLDEIILGWWKEHNEEILVRGTTQIKLQKAVKTGKLTQPSKAVYSLVEPKKDD